LSRAVGAVPTARGPGAGPAPPTAPLSGRARPAPRTSPPPSPHPRFPANALQESVRQNRTGRCSPDDPLPVIRLDLEPITGECQLCEHLPPDPPARVRICDICRKSERRHAQRPTIGVAFGSTFLTNARLRVICRKSARARPGGAGRGRRGLRSAGTPKGPRSIADGTAKLPVSFSSRWPRPNRICT
jgi:hypothetical protein